MRTVCVLFAGILAGCGGNNSGVNAELKPVEFDPDAAAQACLKQFDSNGNGMLEESELASSPGLKQAFFAIDTDRSRSLGASELAARFAKYKEASGVTVPAAVYIRLDGGPLEGASITLEPEPFLGDSFPTLTGVTDDTGRCAQFEHGGNRYSGVPAGIYRIKVTKAGTDIPAKYNTATTLGREFATDGRAAEVEASFDLKSR